MDFRFVAYDPQTGTKLYQLPRANSVSIGDTFGTRGTLELTYSAKAINARDLPTFLEVQAEVTFDEGHNWAPAGPSLLRLSGEHEDTDQAGMRTLRFVGREWVLGKARVGAGDLELIDGKRPFYRASPGQILRTLILEAQDRGAADGIEIGNFTASKDSSGKAWAKVATIYYSPGLPIGSVLENLVEQGMCDYRMDGRTLHLYDPETTMGRDLTTGDNPVRVHGAVTEAPVKYTLEDLANSALLMGDEGFELEVDNPTAPDDYGRLEVTIEQGGVSDSGTARLMVDEALQRGSREVREITRSQSAAGAAFLPFRDYRVGDYVQVHTGGAWERYRVREIQLARDGDEWTIHTIINDRLQELLLKLAKRTNGIVNGSKGSGGDGTRPTPPEKPGIEPAAPEGLVIDQQVYLDRQGIARGQITAGWGEVTESTKGQNVEIGGYELWTRRNETHASWTRAASTDGDLTASHSPVVLSDADGNALEYQWRVRAIAQASNRPGPWSDTVTLTMTQDTTPPPPPSLPLVETDLRIITVEWDGLDEDGEQMPVDFNHVRIYFAAAEDMDGAERVGSLTQPGMWNSGSMDPDVPVWVAVSAVDHVGNESAMTPAQSVTPKKLVDDDSIRDELGTIDGKIDDAVADLNEAIENIVVDANGTTTYWMPTAPDETTDPKPKTGDLWFDTSTAGKNKLHRFDGMAWVSAADERIDTIGQAQDDLEADVDRVRTSVDGKNAVTQSLSSPPSQYDGVANDRWEVLSSMGSGGRVLSTWRWNGTVWVSIRLDDAMIANLDAGKIKSGYIDADRLAAGSINASSIAVGDFSNLATIDPVRDVNVSRPYNWSTETVDGYTTPKPTSQNYLMFKDRTDTVPFKAGDQLRIMFKGVSDAAGDVLISLWGYPSNADGSTSGLQGVYGDRFTISTTEQQFSGIIEIPSSFGASTVLKSWIVGLGPQGGTDMHGVRVRDVRVYRMNSGEMIVDGSITTNKIATGAITAESGIIASLNAGTITSGTIDAARIGADTITADKILVSDFVDLASSVARYPDEWQFNNDATIFTWADGYDGKGVRLTGESPAAYGPYRDTSPGDEWWLEAYAGRYSGATADLNMRVYFYDAQKVYITSIAAKVGIGLLGGSVATPDGAAFARYGMYTSGDLSGGWLSVRDMHGKRRVGSTLIEDGAITTDKILANAITAGKIAALAIEADHISANAITADKINAGAIDGKLITGARIRTAASGRRTELDSEGLTSYRSNGAVVLTTDTSDGSIDMTGRLTQTIGDSTIVVGGNYDGGPGIIWSDSNIYAYPPGIRYGEDPDVAGMMATLVQGPGVTGGSSYLNLEEEGKGFGLAAWQTSGDNRWVVNADVPGNYMRVGSGVSDAPYMSFARGTGDTGQVWIGYNHPTNSGSAQLRLRDRHVYMGSWDSTGKTVGYLKMASDEAVLSGYKRNLELWGGDGAYMYFANTSNGARVQSYTVYSTTSNSGYSVKVNAEGTLFSESSSLRYKQDVTGARELPSILDVDPKVWRNKSSMENHQKLEDLRAQIGEGPAPREYAEAQGEVPWDYGAVAEEVDSLGLTELVLYDQYGRPDALQYEKFGVALIPTIRRLRDRVDALETKLGETA